MRNIQQKRQIYSSSLYSSSDISADQQLSPSTTHSIEKRKERKVSQTKDEKQEIPFNLTRVYKKIMRMRKVQSERTRLMCREAYDKDQQSQFRLDYTWLASKRTPGRVGCEGQNFYLCGGVCVETKKEEVEVKTSRSIYRSVMNDYVQVLGVEVFESRGIVEVKLQNTEKGLTDFGFLADHFEAQSEIEGQSSAYAQKLRCYGEFIDDLLRKKRNLQSIQGFQEFSQIIGNTQSEQSSDTFAQFIKKALTSVQHTNKRILTYRTYKFDMVDFEFKMKAYGYSEDFIKTLGYTNLSQFKDFIMHSGLPEVFTEETRAQIAQAHMTALTEKKNNLASSMSSIDDMLNSAQCSRLQKIPCKLIALDGIEVDTRMDMYLLPFYEGGRDPIFNSIFDCSGVLEIQVYDLSKSTLREIIGVRKQIDFDFDDAVKQDIYYELESQLFVDTYYATTPLKVKKALPQSKLQCQQKSFEVSSDTEMLANSPKEEMDVEGSSECATPAATSRVCRYRLISSNQ